MMESWRLKINRWMETDELLMVDYGIEAKKKVEVDNADIKRFFKFMKMVLESG